MPNRHNHECCDSYRNRYICDPCNFGCPSFIPLQPIQPGPPPPPGDEAHLVLTSLYSELGQAVSFNIVNSFALGANTGAENTIVTITPDPAAVFTLADIFASTGTFEIDLSGNIIWNLGTLALDANAVITIDQPSDFAQVWNAVATTSTPNTPIDNDNETSIEFGGDAEGHLLLDAAWDPDVDEGEGVFIVTNDGAIQGIPVTLVITSTSDVGLADSDIVVPEGVVTVVNDGTSTVITWVIDDLDPAESLELRFPQRPGTAPDTITWNGIATAGNFTQSDGLNEDGFTLSLEEGHFILSSAFDDATNIVSFTAENDGPIDGTSVELILTPDPLNSLPLDASDIDQSELPVGSTVSVDDDAIVTILIPTFVSGDIFTVSFVQSDVGSTISWFGIITADNFVQPDTDNETTVAV